MSKKIYNTTIITYLVTLFSFGLDQWSKQAIINAMPITVDVINHTYSRYPSYEFLPFLWFTHVVNFGAAFSSFFGQKYLLILFASTISLGIMVFEWMSRKERTKLLSFALGFILAGAWGNLFDRIRLGYVTDFFDLRYQGNNIFAIWNVADMSIDLGIGLLILYYIFQEGKQPKDNNKTNDLEHAGT